jgi:hypothetical protein
MGAGMHHQASCLPDGVALELVGTSVLYSRILSVLIGTITQAFQRWIAVSALTVRRLGKRSLSVN